MMNIVFLNENILVLAGAVRALFAVADLAKSLGHRVTVLADKPNVGAITHYRPSQIRQYYPLKHLSSRDLKFVDMFNTRQAVPVIEGADLVWAFSHFLSRIDDHLRCKPKRLWSYIHYPHLGTGISPSVEKVWVNSTYTLKAVQSRMWPQSAGAEILWPPVPVRMYKNLDYTERDIDVVLYSRVSADKGFDLLGRLKDSLPNRIVMAVGADLPSAPWLPESKPKEIRYNLTFKDVRDTLARSKVYVHFRGFVRDPEHLGLAPMEAMACFPYETEIEADGILAVHKRLYSGKLVQIKTGKGVIEATQDHPFYTNNGWTMAKNINMRHKLLYNHEKKSVHHGRIGEIADTIQNNDSRRNISNSKTYRKIDSLAYTQIRSPETIPQSSYYEENRLEGIRDILHGWNNRWRRNSYNSTHEKQDYEATYSNFKYFNGFDELVYPKTQLSRGVHDQRGFETKRLLHILHNGTELSSVVREPTSLLGYQAETYGIDDRMGQITFGTKSRGEFNRSPNRDCANYQDFEYEAIQKIIHRKVRKLPVHNLTTESSAYLANGFLVHNCGCVPVVHQSGGPWLDMLERKESERGFGYSDWNGLIKSIESALSDRGLWEVMNRNARCRIAEMHKDTEDKLKRTLS